MSSSVRPLLCLVGPTATGKTALALKLAALFPSVLLSVDSRQVYQEMDIVTGKDHPVGTHFVGVDLVPPSSPCSVSVWYRAVFPALEQAWGRGVLPLAVGGTGLYFRALTRGIASISIPPSPNLRAHLNSLSVSDLQTRLSQINPLRLNSLNASDRANPRRLIRAIEIALTPSPSVLFTPPSTLAIGLRFADPLRYHAQIIKRVQDRLRAGAVEETRQLLAKYGDSFPSFSALGYPPLIAHLRHELTSTDLITVWTQAELAYARRQLTWFKRDSTIKWFDPSDSSFFPQVVKLVKCWYDDVYEHHQNRD